MDDITYTIEPFLVCDMKCLVRLLGLYDVFNPNSYWKCAWCHCNQQNISDFSIESWNLRDINEMIKIGKIQDQKAESTRSNQAKQYHGTRVTYWSKSINHIRPVQLLNS